MPRYRGFLLPVIYVLIVYFLYKHRIGIKLLKNKGLSVVSERFYLHKCILSVLSRCQFITSIVELSTLSVIFSRC